MKVRAISLLFVLLFVSIMINGQTGSKKRLPTIATSGKRSADAEIRKWLDDWAQAFRAHDVRAVMSLYAPDVVAYDIVPPLQFVGAKNYGKDYEEFMSAYDGPIDVEYRDLHIFASGNIAFVACLERLGGTLKNGQRSDVWVRLTSGFKKINGKWLDIHDHVSVPADFESGKAVLDLKP